jgi:hypothetical protein
MAGQVRGFLPHLREETPVRLLASREIAVAGGKFTRGWAWFASPLNSASSVLKSPHASRRTCSVHSKIEGCGEHRMPVLSHAGQVGMRR